MNLRELRLWHWNQFSLARAQQRRHEAKAAEQPETGAGRLFRRRETLAARVHELKANHHMKAVQALNDVVTGTAEEDAQ